MIKKFKDEGYDITGDGKGQYLRKKYHRYFSNYKRARDLNNLSGKRSLLRMLHSSHALLVMILVISTACGNGKQLRQHHKICLWVNCKLGYHFMCHLDDFSWQCALWNARMYKHIQIPLSITE